MKRLRQNRLPEIWPWLRWLFLACCFLAHALVLLSVHGLKLSAESGPGFQKVYDSYFHGHIIYGTIVGAVCLLIFIAGEFSVPRILKKRTEKAIRQSELAATSA